MKIKTLVKFLSVLDALQENKSILDAKQSSNPPTDPQPLTVSTQQRLNDV